MQYGVTSTMEAEYITRSETMRELLSSSWQMEETMYLCNQYQFIIKFMADGRDNVSMQPVPMSNVRSKR
jgi:hypothetical protein